MSKAILVIDMPESCKQCMCRVIGMSGNFCEITKFIVFDTTTKPNWCPLKPVPEKRNFMNSTDWGDGYDDGWNDCVKEILDI